LVAINSPFIVERIKEEAIHLTTGDDLNVLLDAVGDAKFVLLGEASHGTSEFYTWRTEITKRLIREKGFSSVAVEGDWPSCYRIHRHITDRKITTDSSEELRQSFQRWPSWMWANAETVSLIQWLKKHNENAEEIGKAGFYGLDVYSLWESMEEVIHYLEKKGTGEVDIAKKAFACFEPFDRDPQAYGVSAGLFSQDCEDEVVKLLIELQSQKDFGKEDQESALSAELNALVAVNAEKYYRSMVRGGPDSWNIRDQHMVEALHRLMDFHGSEAKAIIWEHNTHIGDARATDMAEDGMVNVGQLLRENHPKEHVYAIGFGTHSGTVIAGREWGAPAQSMTVPAAQSGSWEDLMHQAGNHDQILIFNDENRSIYDMEIGHRAIGVVYHPENEWGNYVPSVMSERYDAFIYIDETSALTPLITEKVLV
jgi:erythromycin esterase-like protein